MVPNLDTLVYIQECFSDVVFFEKNHTYEIAGKKTSTSVSGLISKYEKEFDAKKVSKNVAKKRGISQDQLLMEWDSNKNYSCHKGSEFHLHAENFLERRIVPLDRILFEEFSKNNSGYDIENYYSEMAILIKNFREFYNWWKEDHIIVKSEFVIGDKESGVCGTIDNLSYNKKTKEFIIFDYKTNKKINHSNAYGEKMLYPLEHLDKCEINKYALQLNLYSIIFEKITNFKIADSYIVWISNPEKFEIFKSKNLRKECINMLNSVSRT